jgi:hypothetical protein
VWGRRDIKQRSVNIEKDRVRARVNGAKGHDIYSGQEKWSAQRQNDSMKPCAEQRGASVKNQVYVWIAGSSMVRVLQAAQAGWIRATMRRKRLKSLIVHIAA